MSGILEKTKCYLVGSMEYSDGTKWREIATDKLKNLNIIVFDPYKKPFIDNFVDEGQELIKTFKSQLKGWNEENVNLVSKRMRAIRSSDLNLVDRSDFLIVYINPAIPSWGSAEEVYLANRCKKPTFIVIEGGKENVPIWLLGTFPYKYFYDSLEEALDMIRKIDSCEVQIDSSRWRLLKKEYR